MNVEGMAGYAFPVREIRPEEVLSVNQFARSIGSPDRRFYSTAAAQAAGYPARPLPRGLPIFFNAVLEEELLDTLGITYGKTLATGVEMEYGVVVTERDALTGATRVAEAYEQAGTDGRLRQHLVLETEFQNEKGEMVTRMKVTFVERAS